jgi:ABC-type sugar transport system permease subunit
MKDQIQNNTQRFKDALALRDRSNKSIINIQGWLSVIPVILIIFLVRGYPLIYGIIKSFTNWNGIKAGVFVGFKNYINILTNEEFWKLLSNNILFLTFIPVQLILGIVVAVLFYEQTVGWKFFRTVFYLPQIISSVVIGFLFTVFFSYTGPVNTILIKLGMPQFAVEWFGQRGTAIFLILVCLVWVNIGWQAMLALGGLSSVDPQVFEAARMDGASYWQRLFKITIPLLGRTIEYSCIISVIWTLTGLFPFIFSMTHGGPGYDTTTVDYMIYLRSFVSSSQLGYACALAVILTLIVLAMTMLQMRYSNKANDWSD